MCMLCVFPLCHTPKNPSMIERYTRTSRTFVLVPFLGSTLRLHLVHFRAGPSLHGMVTWYALMHSTTCNSYLLSPWNMDSIIMHTLYIFVFMVRALKPLVNWVNVSCAISTYTNSPKSASRSPPWLDEGRSGGAGTREVGHSDKKTWTFVMRPPFWHMETNQKSETPQHCYSCTRATLQHDI